MKKKKIMIVDDEHEVVEMMKFMLEANGFETIECFNGIECLDKLKNANPDLIFLDIMMKPIGGWETLEMIKSNNKLKEIPVSIVSVINLKEMDIKKELLEKIENYVVKPFTVNDLINAIEEIFEKKNT